VINNVFAKWKLKRWESNIYIYNDSCGVIHQIGFSSKGKLVWMVGNTYQRNTFAILRAGNRPNSCPRRFLDEDNIEIVIDFEYSVDNKVVLSNILREDFQVLYNHIALPFTAEQVKFFQLSWIFTYSLEYYSLLNLCFQNGHLFESAWWLPLQFKHLNMWGYGSPFLVSNLGGLVFLLALQHYA